MTKRQLADHLSVTPRWIEFQQPLGLPRLSTGGMSRYRIYRGRGLAARALRLALRGVSATQSLTEGVAGFAPIRLRSPRGDSTQRICPVTAPETTFLCWETHRKNIGATGGAWLHCWRSMQSCAVSGAVCGRSNRVGCSCRACRAVRCAVALGGGTACPLAASAYAPTMRSRARPLSR